MKILHIINGLKNGGAEKTLLKLVNADCVNQHIIFVLSRKNDFFSSYFKDEALVFFAEGNLFNKLLHLRSVAYKYKPDILQGWMYHSNLFCFLFNLTSFKKYNVIWNIRNNSLNGLKIFTKIIVLLSGLVSFLFRYKCIYPSFTAKKYHEFYLYRNSFVIPNGFDFSKTNIKKKVFSPVLKLLMVARWDMQKDHNTLFSALALINDFPWILTLVGEGISSDNWELKSILLKYNLIDKVVLLGVTNNIDSVYSENDILLLTSTSESFPNVILEAVSNELLVISSNVGDVELILSSNKWLFNSKDIITLKNLIIRSQELWLNKENWENEVCIFKERIINKYKIDNMVAEYNLIWNSTTT